MESDFFPQGNSNFVPDSDTDIVITPMPCESLNVSVLSDCGLKTLISDILGTYENSGEDESGRTFYVHTEDASAMVDFDLTSMVSVSRNFCMYF